VVRIVVATNPGFGHHRIGRDRTNGKVNQQRTNAKLFWGLLLLILTPVFLFVKPVTKEAVLRDVLLVLWWAFILWLLVTGKKESQGTDSK
jgi:cobalamin biosynthesis protein CobD/CbiB